MPHPQGNIRWMEQVTYPPPPPLPLSLSPHLVMPTLIPPSLLLSCAFTSLEILEIFICHFVFPSFRHLLHSPFWPNMFTPAPPPVLFITTLLSVGDHDNPTAHGGIGHAGSSGQSSSLLHRGITDARWCIAPIIPSIPSSHTLHLPAHSLIHALPTSHPLISHTPLPFPSPSSLLTLSPHLSSPFSLTLSPPPCPCPCSSTGGSSTSGFRNVGDKRRGRTLTGQPRIRSRSAPSTTSTQRSRGNVTVNHQHKSIHPSIHSHSFTPIH